MDISSLILNLVLGIILLTTGKKLYWLFVGVVGFVIGFAVSTQYLQFDQPWVHYAVAIGAGLVGTILAAFVQHLAIAVAGFLVGGYGALQLSGLLGYSTQAVQWMAFIVGGIVGLLLVASVFNWALYLLSSWAGATLVTKSVISADVGVNSQIGLIMFFALFVLGVIIQAGMFRGQPKPAPADIKQEPPNEK